MAPVGGFTRRDGEHMIVHECLRCALVRHNRVAADDDFERVSRLPPSLTSGRRAERPGKTGVEWEDRMLAD